MPPSTCAHRPSTCCARTYDGREHARALMGLSRTFHLPSTCLPSPARALSRACACAHEHERALTSTSTRSESACVTRDLTRPAPSLARARARARACSAQRVDSARACSWKARGRRVEGVWKPCESLAYRGGREAQLCSFGLSGGRPASPLVRVQRALDVPTSTRARAPARARRPACALERALRAALPAHPASEPVNARRASRHHRMLRAAAPPHARPPARTYARGVHRMPDDTADRMT